MRVTPSPACRRLFVTRSKAAVESLFARGTAAVESSLARASAHFDWRRWSGSLVALAACSSSGTEEAPAGGTDGGAPGARALVGNFQISLYEADKSLGTAAFTGLVGKVYDKPPPSAQVLKLDRAEGGCELRVPANPFCELPCTPGVCTADDECTPLAIAQSVGVVRIHGLGPAALTIAAEPPAYAYQPAASENLPNPPCEEGAEVRLEADTFSVQTRCIAPLVLCGPDPLPVRAGEPVHLSWSAPRDPSFSRVHVKLDIAHHGGKKGEIVCDAPDTGSFDIPEALVTRLVGLGVAGFPTIVVGREASAAASLAPQLKLTLTSATERAVDTGVLSCTEDAECPSGATCQDDLSCK